MKKRGLFFLCFVFLTALTLLSVSAAADKNNEKKGTELPDLSRVQNVCVYNLENERVLYSKNEKTKVYPASTAKLMTGIIAVEFYEGRFSDLVTVTEEALKGSKGKNIKLKAGEMLTVGDLIYATVVGGANDAANVLAYEISGTHEIFIDLMNNKAAELGMTNTYYTNPHGYSDPAMHTTAEDTILLAKYAYFNQEFMEISSTVRYTLPETNTSKKRYIYNSNSLISTNVDTKYRNKSAMGMNAGSTLEGGYVAVTAVAKSGTTNLFVVMGGGYDEENIYSYKAINELITWAFENYSYKKILDSGELICELPVRLSSQTDYAVLSPEKSIEYFLHIDTNISEEIKREVQLDYESLEAPVTAGFSAGRITLTYKGEVLETVELVAKNSVDRNSFLYLLARIQNFTKTPKFKITVACIIAVVLIYAGAAVYKLTRGNRYRYEYPRFGRR